MEKKLLREKKLVRKVMAISRPPVTFLFNLLFNYYTCTVELVFCLHLCLVPSSHIWVTIFHRSKREEK